MCGTHQANFLACPLPVGTVASDQLGLAEKNFLVSDRFLLEIAASTFMSLNHMRKKALGWRSVDSSLGGGVLTWATSSNVNGNYNADPSWPPCRSLKEQPALSHLLWINFPPSRYILAKKKKRPTIASGCFCQTFRLQGVESGRCHLRADGELFDVWQVMTGLLLWGWSSRSHWKE